MIMDKISLALVIIGALNWGGIGLFRFDTVAWICGGQGSIVARIIYTLVALAGIDVGLKERENDPVEKPRDDANRRIGEPVREVEIRRQERQAKRP